jgi:hypothetical protein
LGLIVLDTSVLVDHLRDHPSVADIIDDRLGAGERISSSVLTKVELIAGMRSHERRSVRTLVDRLTWIGVTDAVAEQAGAFARRYRHSHPGIGVVDFVIAATVQELNAELWTRNVRHFPMFPGLRPPYP